MLILAVFGTIMQLAHRRARRNLRLAHPPGTIASAVSIGSQSEVGDVLFGKQKKGDMKAALKGKRFSFGYASTNANEPESGGGLRRLTLVMEQEAKARKRQEKKSAGWVRRWLKGIKDPADMEIGELR